MKCDHLRAKRCGQDLGNVTRPRPQGHFDYTRGKVHTHLTDREGLQISLKKTLFNDVSASKRVTLRVSIHSGADSKGSKGAVTRPSRTTDKSQEGTAMGRAGLSRPKPSDSTHKGGDHPMPPQGNLIQHSPSCNGRYVNPQGGSSRPCCQPLLQKLQHWTNRAVNWVYCTCQTPGLKDAPLGRVQLPSSGGSGTGDGLLNLDR